MNNPVGNMMGNMINNAMANNPVMQLMNVVRNGGNPQAMLNQMAQNNPQMQSFMQMINGKSSEQLKQIAMNVSREKGISLDQIANQLGIQIPR